jgi:hypothetical protein
MRSVSRWGPQLILSSLTRYYIVLLALYHIHLRLKHRRGGRRSQSQAIMQELGVLLIQKYFLMNHVVVSSLIAPVTFVFGTDWQARYLDIFYWWSGPLAVIYHQRLLWCLGSAISWTGQVTADQSSPLCKIGWKRQFLPSSCAYEYWDLPW